LVSGGGIMVGVAAGYAKTRTHTTPHPVKQTPAAPKQPGPVVLQGPCPSCGFIATHHLGAVGNGQITRECISPDCDRTWTESF
jgi:hypothetical protein